MTDWAEKQQLQLDSTGDASLAKLLSRGFKASLLPTTCLNNRTWKETRTAPLANGLHAKRGQEAYTKGVS